MSSITRKFLATAVAVAALSTVISSGDAFARGNRVPVGHHAYHHNHDYRHYGYRAYDYKNYDYDQKYEGCYYVKKGYENHKVCPEQPEYD